MKTLRSDQQNGTRYSQGGSVIVRGKTLGWWERKIFTKSHTDVNYTISSKYATRPDLLSFDIYGKASLQWFIMQYNNISDVHEEFVEGSVIVLPTRSRLFGELLTSQSS